MLYQYIITCYNMLLHVITCYCYDYVKARLRRCSTVPEVFCRRQQVCAMFLGMRAPQPRVPMRRPFLQGLGSEETPFWTGEAGAMLSRSEVDCKSTPKRLLALSREEVPAFQRNVLEPFLHWDGTTMVQAIWALTDRKKGLLIIKIYWLC